MGRYSYPKQTAKPQISNMYSLNSNSQGTTVVANPRLNCPPKLKWMVKLDINARLVWLQFTLLILKSYTRHTFGDAPLISTRQGNSKI